MKLNIYLKADYKTSYISSILATKRFELVSGAHCESVDK